MTYSAIARIEHYKHYQAGAVHKEATRELTGYKNPNYDPSRSSYNYYFERMEINVPFEDWIYQYREENGIVGRYLEHSTNPKSETNAMSQALFTVPKYIDTLSRDEQIKVLGYCYDFFKSEFPNVPVLEAVIHFDESSPHLQINFLPVVEREHKKRGKEKIFSTTLLMPGKEFFPQFQDRFFDYINARIEVDLSRQKGSKAKHLSPKEYREVTSELSYLQSQIENEKEDLSFWHKQADTFARQGSFTYKIQLADQLRKMQRMQKAYEYALKTLERWYNYMMSNTAFLSLRELLSIEKEYSLIKSEEEKIQNQSELHDKMNDYYERRG